MKPLECRTCKKPILGEDVNLDRGLARCRACNAVFTLDGTPAANLDRDRPRGPVPLPGKFTVDDLGDALRITSPWFGWQYLFLVFFCILWDGFLVVWYTIALSSKMPGGVNLIMVLFPMIHVAVGLGLTYFTVAGFVNRTEITARAGELRFYHGPLPWFGNLTLDPSALDQLYCEEREHRGKNGTSHSDSVHALLKDGTVKKLLGGLTQASEALFVEQKLEQHLKIRDRAVGGELPR